MHKRKVAIIQSNYIPWKGYFDIINKADIFVIGDDVQYTHGDWRNRNKIKTFTGLKWISIPIQVKGKTDQKICAAEVVDDKWRTKHWQAIYNNYHKTTYFDAYSKLFERLYLEGNQVYLSQINHAFILLICKIMGIQTIIRNSDEFNVSGEKSDRLINICKACDASHYISGPAAKSYLNESLFVKNKIKLEWMDYADYPEYTQLYNGFEHEVSIIDLIFNEGPDAIKFLKSYQDM